MNVIRWKSRLAALAMGGWMLAGCGAPHLKIPHSAYVYDTVIRVRTPDVVNINPVDASTPGSRLYAEEVYQTLLATAPNGEPIPELARRWSHDPNYTHWTLHLNRYAKWWNGRPVASSDVVWSLNFYKNPASGFGHRRELANILSVSSTSPTTVNIVLKRADPDFAADVLTPSGGLWILPAFYLDHEPVASVRNARFLTTLKDVMGSGPYRPYRLTSQSLRWIANTHYYLGAPKTKYLDWLWHPVRPVDLSWTTGEKGPVPMGFRRVSRQSTWEWDVAVRSRLAGLSLKQAADILSAGTQRQSLPGVPIRAQRPPLKAVLIAAGYRKQGGMWVTRQGIPLSVHLQRPSTPYGRKLATRILAQWKREGITLSRAKTAAVTAHLIAVNTLPKVEHPPQFLIPLVYPYQHWTISPRIAFWTANVWMPFYKVEAWRVRSFVKKARQ